MIADLGDLDLPYPAGGACKYSGERGGAGGVPGSVQEDVLASVLPAVLQNREYMRSMRSVYQRQGGIGRRGPPARGGVAPLEIVNTASACLGSRLGVRDRVDVVVKSDLANVRLRLHQDRS